MGKTGNETPAPQRVNATDISYTVALCTHNHADRLSKTLQDIANINQPIAPWELLLIDNASNDTTPTLLHDYSWRSPGWIIRVIKETKLGLAHARNRAVQEARGEYVIFMDDDETPHQDWLVAIENVITTWHPDALGGKIEVLFEESSRPVWLEDELLGFLGRLDHGREARQLTETSTPTFGGNCAFRRALFQDIGYFDTDLGRKGKKNTGGEDIEIYRRMIALGYKVWWVPNAIIYHRIQGRKLRRRYFLALHYRQGQMEGTRARGEKSRRPPAYLIPQLWRATYSVIRQLFSGGINTTLRKEMNVTYFLGYISGWIFGPNSNRDARSPVMEKP
jgi:glycosyltransferase involved in cell wall biosynthesis